MLWSSPPTLGETLQLCTCMCSPCPAERRGRSPVWPGANLPGNGPWTGRLCHGWPDWHCKTSILDVFAMYPCMCVMTYRMTRKHIGCGSNSICGKGSFHLLMYTLCERSWLICGRGRLIGMVCVCHMIWTRCIVMDRCLGIVQELECTGKRRYCLRRKHDLHVTSVVWTHSASFMHQSTLSAPLTLIMLWKIRPLFWMFLSIQSVLWPAGCLGVSCLLFQWHLWKGAFDSFHPLTYS